MSPSHQPRRVSKYRLIYFSLCFVFSLCFCIVVLSLHYHRIVIIFIWIFLGCGMNHQSFYFFLWGNSLWYISALDYTHVSGTNYTCKPRFYCILFLMWWHLLHCIIIVQYYCLYSLYCMLDHYSMLITCFSDKFVSLSTITLPAPSPDNCYCTICFL